MMDWDDIRYFLSVTRHGNLSAAAKELHVSQPTVGRRLLALEAALGVRLLDRTPDGYVLTHAGEEARDGAERLECEAHALERVVGGRDVRLSGKVRVTCTETIATHLLAPCFAALLQDHAEITVELIPDPRELSLSMREADLSVRLSPPIQHDLVSRRIGNLAFGLYASPGYLERHGGSDVGNSCLGHGLITQSDDLKDEALLRWFTELTAQARVTFRTNSHEAAVSAAVHGAGLACLACFRADREQGLIRLELVRPAPAIGVWLVVHRDNREVPRIRAVMTHVVEALRKQRASLAPDASTVAPHDNGSAPVLDGHRVYKA